MTEDRDSVQAPGGESSERGVAVRTGEAARLLLPAATRLGIRMDRQEVRRLCNQDKLTWDRLTDRGWRLVSRASIDNLIKDWTERAERAENPDLPGTGNDE